MLSVPSLVTALVLATPLLGSQAQPVLDRRDGGVSSDSLPDMAFVESALARRAGGPSVTPIPASCPQSCVETNPPSAAFRPTASVVAAAQVYSYILAPGSNGNGPNAALTTCLEQCYGYGTPGSCVAAVWAHHVSGNVYGTSVNGTACLFFNRALTAADLERVDDGAYTGARAINIGCTRPQ